VEQGNTILVRAHPCTESPPSVGIYFSVCVCHTYYASYAPESRSELECKACLSNFRKAKLPWTCCAT